MQQEIFMQPAAIADTISDRLLSSKGIADVFGLNGKEKFARAKAVQIVGCGTSYYASLVAKHWIEEFTGMPCQVDIASEFRYRKHVALQDTLFVVVSQSGETADTMAVLTKINQNMSSYVGVLAICNVPESSIVRAAELVLLTHAGPEIGVASTKAFTTQLTALFMLTLALGAGNENISPGLHDALIAELKDLPLYAKQVLKLDKTIRAVAQGFKDKQHALFLGRGIYFPLALEGALKLKEISYIHAEGYPAGELKHGPLALIDSELPVVVLAPNNHLLAKIKSNIQEVCARGGNVFSVCARKRRL